MIGQNKANICRLCGAQARLKCEKLFFKAQPIKYYECQRCQFLQAEEFDVSEVYKGHLLESDFGWQQRNKKILQVIDRIIKVPLLGGLGREVKILDFGCGSGYVVKQLRFLGYRAYGYDPFRVGTGESKEQFLFSDLKGFKRGEINLVICIEVLEHLWQPLEAFEPVNELLSERGYVLISTGRYKPRKHDCSWWYLNPKAGHVSLFSKGALSYFLKKSNLHIVLKITDTLYLTRKNSGIVLDSWDFVLKTLSYQKALFQKFLKAVRLVFAY